LKTQLQEAKRIEEVLSKQLNDKEQNCETLEAEIVLLRRKLEKGIDLSKFEISSKILDDILDSQRPSSNKNGLCYDHKETNKGSISGILKSDKNPKTYATALQNSFKRERN
jgi:hypothetical protein